MIQEQEVHRLFSNSYYVSCRLTYGTRAHLPTLVIPIGGRLHYIEDRIYAFDKEGRFQCIVDFEVFTDLLYRMIISPIIPSV